MNPDAYKEHNKPESGAQPGVYKHENTSEELHAGSFPAADAFVRQGWVYDRPLPARDTNPNGSTPGSSTNVDSKKEGK